MKRTVVKIQANDKGDMWCDVSGTGIDIMGAYGALTENIIGACKKEGLVGQLMLTVLLRDMVQTFKESGIELTEEK